MGQHQVHAVLADDDVTRRNAGAELQHINNRAVNKTFLNQVLAIAQVELVEVGTPRAA
ncbi:hypothetical protein D3C84_862420 [compost metagenome]